MGSRLLFVVVLTLWGCAQAEPRGYYAPIESAFAGVNPYHLLEHQGTGFRVRSQGAYLNTVAGVPRRTYHLQMEITRSRDGNLRLDPADLRLRLSAADGSELAELSPSEIWQSTDRVKGPLQVLAWRRHAYDLFFDVPAESPPEPAVLRLRWRWSVAAEAGFGDCSFRRLAADDPQLPRRLSGTALKFGVLNGFYMPGWGELGSRGLRPTEEERQHHLFHAPGSWWP